MRKLIITVGIEKNADKTFTDRGSIKTKCPNCQCPIELQLTGLREDDTLSPVVTLRYEEVK